MPPSRSTSAGGSTYPLPEFFVHANGVSLLRHVGAKGEILDKPAYPWARRCAVRTADGCMALVATAIAHAQGRPSEQFASYADNHLNRALAPLAVVSGKNLFRAFGPRKIVALVKGGVDLRAYKVSGRADSDTWDERVHYLRSAFERLSEDIGVPEEIRDVYIDRIVTVLAGPPQLMSPRTARRKQLFPCIRVRHPALGRLSQSGVSTPLPSREPGCQPIPSQVGQSPKSLPMPFPMPVTFTMAGSNPDPLQSGHRRR